MYIYTNITSGWWPIVGYIANAKYGQKQRLMRLMIRQRDSNQLQAHHQPINNNLLSVCPFLLIAAWRQAVVLEMPNRWPQLWLINHSQPISKVSTNRCSPLFTAVRRSWWQSLLFIIKHGCINCFDLPLVGHIYDYELPWSTAIFNHYWPTIVHHA